MASCLKGTRLTVAQQRLPVRKIRDVLRLEAAGLSDRKIAAVIDSARDGANCEPLDAQNRLSGLGTLQLLQQLRATRVGRRHGDEALCVTSGGLPVAGLGGETRQPEKHLPVPRKFLMQPAQQLESLRGLAARAETDTIYVCVVRVIRSELRRSCQQLQCFLGTMLSYAQQSEG